MRPFFQIIQGETDVTSRVGQGNISLNINDGVGFNSDTMDYEISDEDGIIAEPRSGVDVKIRGGYLERAPRDFGTYTIDEVVLKGWPQIIAVNGQSRAAKSASKETRSKSFKKKDAATYGQLIESLAKRNELKAAIDPEIAAIPLEYEAQTEETDMNFLSRMGNRLGFSFSIKDKNLIIAKRGLGRSASGLLLPEIQVIFGVNVISYSVSRKDRPRYSKVKATWFDRDKVKRNEVDAASSSEGPEFTIRTPFKTEEEAVKAARSKADDLKRSGATAEFVITGDEQARAEAFVRVEGIRSLVDGDWRATTVGHSFGSGYTTTISCELPGAENGAEATS